jgi:HlyD family secretion protein
MTAPAKSKSQSAIRRHLLAGGIIAAVLTAGVAGWARTTQIAGAVIGMGVVVADSNVKKVQHPTGGIVGELNVKNGYLVNAGDILIRLNETQTRANLAVITKSLDELYARRARLEAEKDGADSITFPDELLSREKTDPVVAHLVEGERKLFALRLGARVGQKKQLGERISQLREEVGGLVEQVEAKGREIAFIQEELKGVMELWEKNLIPITRLTALKRDAARLEGERGQLVAYKASTAGKIAETELQIIQVDEDARSKVAEELSDVRAKISELSEREISAEYELDHIDIRAPQTGRVHQLEVHTVGGVIKPGETIMLIVPKTTRSALRRRSRRPTSIKSVSVRPQPCASPPSISGPRRKSWGRSS